MVRRPSLSWVCSNLSLLLSTTKNWFSRATGLRGMLLAVKPRLLVAYIFTSPSAPPENIHMPLGVMPTWSTGPQCERRILQRSTSRRCRSIEKLLPPGTGATTSTSLGASSLALPHSSTVLSCTARATSCASTRLDFSRFEPRIDAFMFIPVVKGAALMTAREGVVAREGAGESVVSTARNTEGTGRVDTSMRPSASPSTQMSNLSGPSVQPSAMEHTLASTSSVVGPLESRSSQKATK
mmetsp:Transcript_15521/g.34273  ORF Transcript_15521/g.34273 Transcript_15521/m.34273 type:complete len:239 (-) Transcript_15521:1424-2140(-)